MQTRTVLKQAGTINKQRRGPEQEQTGLKPKTQELRAEEENLASRKRDRAQLDRVLECDGEKHQQGEVDRRKGGQADRCWIVSCASSAAHGT